LSKTRQLSMLLIVGFNCSIN